MPCSHLSFFFFFFNDTATTEIYTLSLHDALPILETPEDQLAITARSLTPSVVPDSNLALTHVSGGNWNLVVTSATAEPRSEEHTSELQSRLHLVCRLLLEKKKKQTRKRHITRRPH